MGTLEMVLLITGGIIFVLSFLLPSGRKKADSETKQMVQDEVKNVVAREMDDVKDRIEDIVDETVAIAVEKTERSLERVSNEKIMAVNEYSDTVLEDINKNHKEVMFLYDMLNDKHQNIKSTVSQVEKTVKAVEQTAREAAKEVKKETVKEERKAEAQTPKSNTQAKKAPLEASKVDISFMQENQKNGNNNEKILEMHNAGKSNVAIAKALGLGVGEVKLVIDLFEGM